MQIEGLSEEDELLLAIEEVKESVTPSRCPRCGNATVSLEECDEGSLCGFECGSGGFLVSCSHCNLVISEAECEEGEEE